MPLSLPAPSDIGCRPQRLVYTPDTLEQQEAFAEAEKLKQKGWTLIEQRLGELVYEPPKQDDEDLCIMRALTENGDDRLVWNRRYQAEVEEAKRQFESYKGRGYTAYAIRSDGSKGSRVDTFEALEEELLLAKEAMLVPGTNPS